MASPTSEVGSVPNMEEKNINASDLQQLVQNQQQQIDTLLKAIGVNNYKDVQLPEFDPDKPTSNAHGWINTCKICVHDQDLRGATLIKMLSSSLKGSAADWLTEVCYPEMTWKEFENIFIARYDREEGIATIVFKILDKKPNDGECLASYAATAVTTLMSKCNVATMEEVAVGVIMAHLARFDRRVQHRMYTSSIKTRNQLQQELQSLSIKRHHSDQQNTESKSQNKRFKPMPLTCYKCGKLGHKALNCGQTTDKIMDKFNVTCYKCNKTGHYASKCRVTDVKGEERRIVERKVNTCTLVNPIGTLLHNGNEFEFCFDSGAECSIIREKVALTIKGKRMNNLVHIIGIGQNQINCTLQILSNVTINNIVLEVLFHVLPNFSISYDILIGREILSMGVSVTFDTRGLTFQRSCVIYSNEKDNSKVNFENISTDIPSQHKNQLLSVLNEFKENFICGMPKHTAKVEPMQIRLKDPTRTVNRRPYRLSDSERSVVRQYIDELLNAKIIQPSISPFASPILLVKKKDGSDRLCVDYRELNDNTVPERFPLPLISEQIDRLQGSWNFTTLDMASGYHQIPMHHESMEKTAFVTPDGHYEYLSTPFGLRNAPSAFQKRVLQVLGDLARSYVVVYMDDILILGTTDIKETLGRLRTVLETLATAGISLNLKKCMFLKHKIEYLGFEVCEGKIKPNPKKIEALVSLPPPETVTQLRQFIGLASYFRQFIKDFSQIMAPLYALTSHKHSKIDWCEQHEIIRQKVLIALTNEPVLTLFDTTLPIELHTDASAIGYGAILMQKKEKYLQVVAYFSKRTTNAEAKYHSFELETLAVVNAIKHFRHYLYERSFTVVTDCNALQASRKKKDLAPRVHRWWAFLQTFEFEIVYRKGKSMAHVDFLSRNPLQKDQTIRTNVRKEVNINEITPNWLVAEQQRDKEIAKIVSDIKEQKLMGDILNTYELRKGILHRNIQRNGKTRCLPIIPRAFRWSFVNSAHVSLFHVGYEKTLEKLYEIAWFVNMATYVKKYISSCITCRVAKTYSGKIEAELHSIPKVPIPWHTVHIDATGKLSGKNDQKEYVFVFIDAFTKFVILRHTLRIDSTSIIEALKYCVSLFGAPKRVIADQGRCFASTEFRLFCSSHGINLHLIATGSSRANGQVERVMSTLKNMLTAVELNNNDSWQHTLPEVQLTLNCTINRVAKSSPLELLIGRTARPLSLLTLMDEEVEVNIDGEREKASANMTKNASYDKIRFDRTKSKVVRFKVGDFVLLQNEERNQTKLNTKYKGPFKVIEVLEGDRYTLAALDSKRKYKYAHDRLRSIPSTDIDIEFDQNND